MARNHRVRHPLEEKIKYLTCQRTIKGGANWREKGKEVELSGYLQEIKIIVEKLHRKRTPEKNECSDAKKK